MFDQPHTRIFVEDLMVEVHVGFAAWEKHPEKRVPLLVTVDMYTRQTNWPDPTLDNLIDYTRVYEYVATWPNRPHVESLEALCEDMLDFCFSDSRVAACRVRLKKPHVMANARGAGVEIYRMRASAEK